MSAGAIQTLEGLVQNRNDPPLFPYRWQRNGKFTKLLKLQIIDVGAICEIIDELPICIRPQ